MFNEKVSLSQVARVQEDGPATETFTNSLPRHPTMRFWDVMTLPVPASAGVAPIAGNTRSRMAESNGVMKGRARVSNSLSSRRTSRLLGLSDPWALFLDEPLVVIGDYRS